MVTRYDSAIVDLLRTFEIPELVMAAARGVGLFVLPFLALIFLLERASGGPIAKYRTRAFFNDLMYALFYRGGFYNLLISAAIVNALRPQLDFLNVGLMTNAPFPLSIAVFWIGGDFVLYWVHRLQHTSRFLWAFHCIHHAPRELTTLTQYRRHPVDWFLGDVTLFLLFVVVLGIPTGTWMPLYIGMTALQALQHAELDWKFGPFYPMVVSPVFHSQHHSIEARDHHNNYAVMFSIWDYMFGTAVPTRERPARYGVSGLRIPEVLISQVVAPFSLLTGHAGRWGSLMTPRANRGREAKPPCNE